LPLFFFLSRRRCALFIITPFFEKMALTQTLGVRGFGTFP
jgi:hypothetical protein